MKPLAVVLFVALVCCPVLARADDDVSRKLYEQVKPSLVAVKYTWENELESHEWVAAGVIVGEDGLVAIPIGIVTPLLVPDGQMKDFKIIVPSEAEDETEVEATLEGRDERSSLAFIRAKTPQKWTAVHFVDEPLEVGQRLYSVGILPKSSGYHAYVTAVTVSAKLRGPVPQVLVDGELAGVGSPVFDDKGQGVGYVPLQGMLSALLDNPENPQDLRMIYNPAKTFVVSSDFLFSVSHPPAADQPIVIPWIGCPQLKGLDKEFAEFMGLQNVPAVQIGDVAAGSPAEHAGLKTLDIIIKMNGQPLERGDQPIELPYILSRKIQRMNVGQTVTFTVIHQKGDTPRDVAVTLEPRPKQVSSARRFYAKDLGFVVREAVFSDTYRRKMSASTGGVVIAMLRPQAAAQAAKLSVEDLVVQMNGKPLTDLDQFKKDYLQFRKDKPRDAVVLVVSRVDGKEQTINIEPPQDEGAGGGSGGGQ